MGHLMGMRSSSSDHFSVMQLASCSTAPAAFQGLDEVMVAGNSHKRPFYSLFESSEEAGDDLDQLGDEYALQAGKKIRRLTTDQVKALEKNFEIENKLEPERKLHLARELGLQPRQVAVWFQNRRARWKTKQLEKDYDILKTEYAALKRDYDAVLQEKEKLQTQLLRLNEKLKTSDSDHSQPPKELKREISVESTGMHMPSDILSHKEGHSDLIPFKPLRLFRNTLGEDIGSSSSESDDSEVLDVESPLALELPNLVSTHADPPALISNAGSKKEFEDEELMMFPLNHITQRSVVKLEDESYHPEENSSYLFNLEEHVTSFSWWEQWS